MTLINGSNTVTLWTSHPVTAYVMEDGVQRAASVSELLAVADRFQICGDSASWVIGELASVIRQLIQVEKP